MTPEDLAEFVFGRRQQKGCGPLIYTIDGSLTHKPRDLFVASLLVLSNLFYVTIF